MTPYPFEQAARSRRSVRTFSVEPVAEELKNELLSYAAGLTNPFGHKVRFALTEHTASPDGEKLGTYGIIKNASLFLGAAVPSGEGALEALGYDFEKVVLYAHGKGLGTCWLGGTFTKSAFAKALSVREDELFPVISPVGYPAGKRLFERAMRMGIRADSRLAPEKLFFDGSFSQPLSDAGDLDFALDMVRIAPSAANKQPWRILRSGSSWHFFEQRSMASSDGPDLQRVDVGIALCHFDLAVQEKGIAGSFVRENPGISLPEGMEYVATWRRGH